MLSKFNFLVMDKDDMPINTRAALTEDEFDFKNNVKGTSVVAFKSLKKSFSKMGLTDSDREPVQADATSGQLPSQGLARS